MNFGKLLWENSIQSITSHPRLIGLKMLKLLIMNKHTCFTNGGLSLPVNPIKAKESLRSIEVILCAATLESASYPLAFIFFAAESLIATKTILLKIYT